jgi:hypothetical protein
MALPTEAMFRKSSAHASDCRLSLPCDCARFPALSCSTCNEATSGVTSLLLGIRKPHEYLTGCYIPVTSSAEGRFARGVAPARRLPSRRRGRNRKRARPRLTHRPAQALALHTSGEMERALARTVIPHPVERCAAARLEGSRPPKSRAFILRDAFASLRLLKMRNEYL